MFGKKIFYGWYIVAASLLLIILDGLLLYSFGVFLPYINDDFGLSRAEGSALFSIRSVLLAPGFIIAGKLIDKYDPRAVIFGGGSIAALGMILSGYAQNMWQLVLFYSVLVGIGDTVLYITCVAIISRWFVKKRALAIGIVTTGVPLSGLITNPLTATLISNFGFRHALISLGLIMLVTLMAALVLRAYPRDIGLVPYGNEKKPPLPKHHGHNDSDYDEEEIDWSATEAISTPTYWVMYSMYTFAFITFLIIVTQFYNFEIDLDISPIAAAGPPAAIGLGSIIGRTIITSLLAEMLDFRKVLFGCLTLQGSSIIILLTFDHIWAFYAFGFLFGFFYSGCVPIFPTLLARFYGLKAMGTIYGIFGTSYSIAAIGAPILAGYVFDLKGSYYYPFLFSIVCCYLAAIGSFFIKTPVKKTGLAETTGS